MVLSPHLHTEHSFGVTLQRAQQQAALGVSYADGAVVGADQQHSAGSLLRRTQAADTSRAVALKHVQLLQILRRERDQDEVKKKKRSVASLAGKDKKEDLQGFKSKKLNQTEFE